MAISRRGLRSRGHAFGYTESSADFAIKPEPTALGVLRRVRAAVRLEATLGLTWQAALDRVRKQGRAIWNGLQVAERRRLVLKLRVWWDVHRFRIAPPVEAVLDRLEEGGRLVVAAGHLHRAETVLEGLQPDWRQKGEVLRHDTFDAVILTTGPAHDAILESSGMWAGLARQGLLRADPLQLGLDVNEKSLALDVQGMPVPGLYIAGPLVRGQFGELMGIPEVTANTELVASHLARRHREIVDLQTA